MLYNEDGDIGEGKNLMIMIIIVKKASTHYEL